MNFDPLSWAVGYTLNKGANRIVQKIFSKELSDKLSEDLIVWAKKLPDHFELHPEAMFPKYNEQYNENDLPKLHELHSILAQERIPSKDQWNDALKEHFVSIKNRLGTTSQSFFHLELEDVEIYLIELAAQFETTMKKDEDFFRIETISSLKELEQKQNLSIEEIKKNSKISTEEIRSLINAILNDIKGCIEGSEMMVIASGYGSQSEPINLSPIELNSYEHIKTDLIKANIFIPKEWAMLEKITKEVKEVNEFNLYKNKYFASYRVYWSVKFFENLWNIVAKKYLIYGGNFNDLVQPLRIENLEKYVQKNEPKKLHKPI